MESRVLAIATLLVNRLPDRFVRALHDRKEKEGSLHGDVDDPVIAVPGQRWIKGFKSESVRGAVAVLREDLARVD